MQITREQFDLWLDGDEDENLEFKEAKHGFDSKKLVRYCAALANEGGGWLVLGVTDKKPRRVVGSGAFRDLEERKHWLLQKLHLRIEASEIDHPQGRVVVFSVPCRPSGVPIAADGDYVMRSGSSLTSMTPEKLKSIFDEGGPDFSAEICPDANFDHLDTYAIETFRSYWLKRSGNSALSKMSHRQLLDDSDLSIDGQLTFAALLLLGTPRALGRFLPDAEVVFEWRLRETSTQYDQRKEFRKGLFLCFDEIWEEINGRNQVHQYQNGLFRAEIPTFREKPIREAILNAVAHRDYRTPGSIFIRQSPTSLEVSSPGGFPEGITVENIIWKQKPRNRRIAENLARVGLVERSGQGADLMFEWAVRDSKPLPDFHRTDPYEVVVRLDGQVRDEKFVRFLEEICAEKQVLFGVDELLVLEKIRDGKKVDNRFDENVRQLLEMGAIERHGRKKYTLSNRYYAMVGKKGVYTRKRGLDKETNKALLLQHIVRNAKTGSTAREFQQVLPNCTRNQIYPLISELKKEGKIEAVGNRRNAVWYPRKKEKNGDE